MRESRTVAAALYSTLAAAGCTRVFGVFGREVAAFGPPADGLPEFVSTRHEFSATMIAYALARMSGKFQTCYATLGPGAMNLANGLAAALLDRVPVLGIAAQIEKPRRRYGHVHQCVDARSVLAPVCKYASEPDSQEELWRALAQAVTAMLTPPMGPAFLSVPIDLLSEVCTDPPQLAPHPMNQSVADTSAILDIAKLVDSSSRPVILCGENIARSESVAEFRAFVEHLGAPVASSYIAKGTLPKTHPQNVGAVSRHTDAILRSSPLEAIFAPADLIIMVGLDPAEDLPVSLWRVGAAKRVVAINNYHQCWWDLEQFDAVIIGPISESLKHLQERVGRRRFAGAPRISDLSDRLMRDQGWTGSGATPFSLHADLEAVLPDCILATDVGMHRHSSVLGFDAKSPLDFLTSAGLSSFGVGLPLGIGAQLAHPERRVVVTSGDVAFTASAEDLETALRLKARGRHPDPDSARLVCQ
jgi:thiamine pyrophosphate-dependent acetolactate synthase large subunit-like protein